MLYEILWWLSGFIGSMIVLNVVWVVRLIGKRVVHSSKQSVLAESNKEDPEQIISKDATVPEINAELVRLQGGSIVSVEWNSADVELAIRRVDPNTAKNPRRPARYTLAPIKSYRRQIRHGFEDHRDRLVA